MLIISTKPVAAIIQAVSPLSTFGAVASASAGVASDALVSTMSGATRCSVFLMVPLVSDNRRRTTRRHRLAGPSVRSQRVGVGLAGADADRVADVGDEDLSVADLPGLGGSRDRIDHLVDAIGRHRHLDLHLRQEVHGVLGAAINFGVAFLAAIALHLGDGHAADAEPRERVAHVLELEWLDDGNDELHGTPPGTLKRSRRTTEGAGRGPHAQTAHDIVKRMKN